MEYEELKSMWKKYDRKLDNLEKINKKIILETLLTKPRKRLKWIKFNSIYTLIAVPVILLIIVFPHLKLDNLEIKFFVGSVMVLSVIAYVSYLQFKSYLILKRISLETDSVIESAEKISSFKSLYNTRWKHAAIYYPIIYAGFLLITWKSFNFDIKTIIFLTVIFIITYIANIKGPKIYRDRMERLEKEIINLKEYID
jgi:integral membrane sensor domain MASE1